MNKTPEQAARENIDRKLGQTGWAVADRPIDEASHNRREIILIECRNVTGMRDSLIHDYFGVNYRIVGMLS